MNTIGRNDSCPCGSGKKYKKCCLISDEANDFKYRRQLNMEAGLIGRLNDFALELHGLEGLEAAWREFSCSDNIEMIPADSPMHAIFMPWFLYTWLFEATNAESDSEESLTVTNSLLFTIENQSKLTDEETAYLGFATGAIYSLCEVVETRPGVGLVLRDLFLETEFGIHEHLASKSLHPGQIIYCATMEIDGVKSNLCMAPYALRPTSKREVFELRKAFLKALRKRKLTEEHLIEFEEDIRTCYLNEVDSIMSPPRLVNTDQEPMLFQKVYFELDSVQEAFHLLKNLAADSTEEDLLRDAEVENDRIVSVEIPWVRGSEEGGGPILLASLRLTEGQLVASVNSNERANLIRAIIEERLGDLVRYKTTLIEPIESEIDAMWAAAAASQGSQASQAGQDSDSGVDPRSDEELRALMTSIAKQHWDTWYDIPIPGLNNKTPREATRTKEGRDLLESLLHEYEINNAAADDNPMRADIPSLRRELGLD